MRKLLYLSIFSLIITLVFFLTGCPNGDNNGEEDEIETLSFESFSPRSISIENKTDKRLVGFKNTLSLNNLISGIPAYAGRHGLKRDSSLFNQTGDFVLVLITEEDFNKNRSNIAAAPVFAKLYVFYNHEADSSIVYQISSYSGGAGSVIINNPAPWNVEIRKDSPTGEIIGFAAAQTTGTILRLQIPHDYNLFPVFKRYNAAGEIYSIVPMYTTDPLTGKPFTKSFTLNDETSQVWDLSEITSTSDFKMTSGMFFVKIINDSVEAVIFTRNLWSNEVVLFASTGEQFILPGRTYLYGINVMRNPDGTYPDRTTINTSFNIGIEENMLPVLERDYKTDYIYSIRVTGSSALTLALDEVEEVGKLDIETLF